MPDYSNPLITNRFQERTEYVNNLLLDWVTATQLKDLSNVIQERTFSELEFFGNRELSLLTGSPPGHPTTYNYFYKIRSLVNEHLYSAFNFVADEGDFASFNDFYGWKYDLNEFYRVEYYADNLINYAVWNIYSRSASSTPATDVIKLYNNAGTEISSTNRTENTSLNLSTGLARGIRTQSSTTTTFQLKVGSTVINTFSNTAANSVAVDNLPSTLPIINNADFINIEYLPARTVQVDLLTGLPVILHQIKVYFYGAYWAQDLILNNIFEQGWVTHPLSTNYSTRIKPPGKYYLSDSYNNETNTSLTSNYTQTNTTTSGTIL